VHKPGQRAPASACAAAIAPIVIHRCSPDRRFTKITVRMSANDRTENSAPKRQRQADPAGAALRLGQLDEQEQDQPVQGKQHGPI